MSSSHIVVVQVPDSDSAVARGGGQVATPGGKFYTQHGSLVTPQAGNLGGEGGEILEMSWTGLKPTTTRVDVYIYTCVPE